MYSGSRHALAVRSRQYSPVVVQLISAQTPEVPECRRRNCENVRLDDVC